MPNDHNPDDKHDGEFDGVTRLFIRTNPADDGSVPLPSGLAFWTSPDISIVKPGGAVGGEAVPLQPNKVRVTVFNGGGIPAVDAYVDAFVADPSTVITPTTAKPIGGDYVTIQGYSSSVLDLPWTPDAQDAGHRCIIARVSLIAPPDTYTNPGVFDVVGDRHVAQRNISVLSVPAGGTMTFRFLMRPLTGERQVPVRLLAQERTREVTAHYLALMSGCAPGLPATQPLASLGVRMLSRREGRGRPSLDGSVPIELGLLRRAEEANDEREANGRLDPQSGARAATVSFTVAADEEPGRLHLVDVMQVNPENEQTEGGLTFIITVS